MTSLQALLRKAFRSPGDLLKGDIFWLFLPCASREVKISRKCLTCLPKQGSSATENNRYRFNAKQRRFNAKNKIWKNWKNWKNQRETLGKIGKNQREKPLENQKFSIFFHIGKHF